MADDNELLVKIGADITELKKALKKSEDDLKKFTKETEKTAKSTDKLGGSSKKLGDVVKVLGRETGSTANKIKDIGEILTKSSGNAGDLTGAVGKTTKGFGSLAKAIPYVGIAITAGLFLWSMFGDKLIDTRTEAQKLIDKNKELAKSLKLYKDGLDSVSSANLVGSQNAQKELTNLRLLKAQVDDTNLSNEKRIEAVDELQRKYPSYLGNITDEDALVGGLDTKYDELSTAILKMAKAQAGAKIIGENFQKQLNLEAQLRENSLKISQDQLLSEQAYAQAIVQSQTTQGTGTKSNIELGKKYDAQVKSGLETQATLVAEINRLATDSLNLSKQIAENGGIVPLDFGKPKGLDGTKKDVVKNIKALFTEDIPKLVDTPLVGLGIDFWARVLKGEELQIEKDKIKASLEEFSNSAKSIIQGGLTNTFASLGEAIGNAFATGENAIQAGGQAILAGLGGILVQFGKLVIATGVASEAFKKSITNPFGGGIGAVVAGVALVAIGSAMKSFSSGLGSSGGGGGSTSSGADYSSSGGSNRSYGSSSSYATNGGGTYVFEIAGTKLIGVLQNTLKRNKSFGGNITFG